MSAVPAPDPRLKTESPDEMATRVRQLSLPDAVTDYMQSLLPDWPAERVQLLSDRLGLTVYPAPTLQACADRLGLTRERIRQLEGKIATRRDDFHRRPFLPQLERSLSAVNARAPVHADDAEIAAACGIDPRILEPLAIFFGRGNQVFTMKVGRRHLVARSDQRKALSHLSTVRKIARRQSGRYGASNVRQLRWGLQESEDLHLTDEEIGWALKALGAGGVDDWFWFPLWGERSRFFNTSRKMLAANSPQTLRSLREGLRRRAAFRGDSIVPPLLVLRQLYEACPAFRVDDTNRQLIHTTAQLDAETLLGSVQYSIVRTIEDAPNGLLDRESIMRQCRELGVNLSSAGVYLTYGECIEHIAANVWAVRGSKANPAVVQAYLERLGARPPRHSAEGWTTDGKPWIAFEITASFLASPAIALPSSIKRFVGGQEFTIATSDRPDPEVLKPDATGGFMYGFNGFVKDSGADVGDILRVTFSPLSGTAKMELGDRELLVD